MRQKAGSPEKKSLEAKAKKKAQGHAKSEIVKADTLRHKDYPSPRVVLMLSGSRHV